MRIISGIIGIVAFLVTILCLIFIPSQANAGETSGFAVYAKQGIINQLTKVYGKNGIPYTVVCIDVSHFPNQSKLVDTVMCKIREK